MLKPVSCSWWNVCRGNPRSTHGIWNRPVVFCIKPPDIHLTERHHKHVSTDLRRISWGSIKWTGCTTSDYVNSCLRILLEKNMSIMVGSCSSDSLFAPNFQWPDFPRPDFRWTFSLSTQASFVYKQLVCMYVCIKILKKYTIKHTNDFITRENTTPLSKTEWICKFQTTKQSPLENSENK